MSLQNLVKLRAGGFHKFAETVFIYTYASQAPIHGMGVSQSAGVGLFFWGGVSGLFPWVSVTQSPSLGLRRRRARGLPSSHCAPALRTEAMKWFCLPRWDSASIAPTRMLGQFFLPWPAAQELGEGWLQLRPVAVAGKTCLLPNLDSACSWLAEPIPDPLISSPVKRKNPTSLSCFSSMVTCFFLTFHIFSENFGARYVLWSS
jgi:hypothetical protein